MQSAVSTLDNTTVAALPETVFTGPTYSYRESPWVTLLLRAVLAASGGLSAHFLLRSALAGPLMPTAALALTALAISFLALTICRDGPPHFIRTPSGVYFPETKNLWRQPGRWLLVPWNNVIDYRIQPMLDETSSQGVMLAIRATPDEERRYFSGHRLFKLSALLNRHRDDTVLVGYTTFLPRPDEVLYQLRRFEAMQ